jgi:hypothetical protein
VARIERVGLWRGFAARAGCQLVRFAARAVRSSCGSQLMRFAARAVRSSCGFFVRTLCTDAGSQLVRLFCSDTLHGWRFAARAGCQLVRFAAHAVRSSCGLSARAGCQLMRFAARAGCQLMRVVSSCGLSAHAAFLFGHFARMPVRSSCGFFVRTLCTDAGSQLVRLFCADTLHGCRLSARAVFCADTLHGCRFAARAKKEPHPLTGSVSGWGSQASASRLGYHRQTGRPHNCRTRVQPQ